MIFGIHPRVNRYLQKFERNYISFEEMKDIVLDTYTPFTIKWRTKEGVNKPREMYTVFGPGGKAMSGVEYWKSPYNYMIAYSVTDGGFRTIRLKEVEWIESDGRKYYIR